MTELPPPQPDGASPTLPPPPPYAPPGFPQQPVYVVQHRTHHGIGGWLGVWMALFVIAAISYVGGFFGSLGDANPADSVFFAVMATLCAVTVVLIASRRRLGRGAALATMAVGWMYTSIRVLVEDGDAAGKASAVIISAIVTGALALYFVQSDRVRQTLTR